MTSIASDLFKLTVNDDKDHMCHKFVEVSLPLLSVPRLCIKGYHVYFNQDSVFVIKNGRIVTRGQRDPARNLYLILLPAIAASAITAEVARVKSGGILMANARALNAYELRVVPQLIQYLHGAAGFLPKLTWIDAINAGFYSTWLGLTAALVRQYLPDTNKITVMGHQKLIRQGI